MKKPYKFNGYTLNLYYVIEKYSFPSLEIAYL